MSDVGPESGVTLIELLICLGVLVLVLSSLSVMLVHNARIDRSVQMSIAAQANARNSLAMITEALRTAGWDPKNQGFAAVGLDSSPTGPDNYIEVYADLDEDGSTASVGEEVVIRHHSGRIEWRKMSSLPFTVLSEDITNDANGDGTIEPMFTPDSVSDPTRILVRITARSPVPSPQSGQYILYTIDSEVALRESL